MNKSPAYQRYSKDYLSSVRVQMMSLAEEGAYNRLLEYCWLNGHIPADAAKVARLVGKGCTVEIAKVCLEMFQPDPNDETRMIHDRLEAEREKQISNSNARKLASEARWSKQGKSADGRGKQVNTNSSSDDMQMQSKRNAFALQTESFSSSISTAYAFSSSDEKEKGGGGRSANGNGVKPPPTAAAVRQWSELTSEEKQMTFGNFLQHLQIENPKKNVRQISQKLKDFCARNKKDFKLERLKGWVIGEGAGVSDADFEAAFGLPENSAEATTAAAAALLKQKYGGGKNGA